MLVVLILYYLLITNARYIDFEKERRERVIVSHFSKISTHPLKSFSDLSCARRWKS